MGQMQRLGKSNTVVLRIGGKTRVILHETEVVKFDTESIWLDSGGWETVTTKARMNQASNEFNLGYGVYQKDYQWYVDFRGETYKFVDGMRLRR